MNLCEAFAPPAICEPTPRRVTAAPPRVPKLDEPCPASARGTMLPQAARSRCILGALLPALGPTAVRRVRTAPSAACAEPPPPPAGSATAPDTLSEWALPRARSAGVQPGHVYFVATPIGNLDDLTFRAVRALRDADVIAAEDTRVTAALLRYVGAYSGPRKPLLVAHHEHNLNASVPRLVRHALEGRSVAVVYDAGTPGISDPGAALAAALAAARVPCVPLPGACAALAALSVSGFATPEWTFGGFLPRAGRARRERIAALAAEDRAVVLYEAPHRLRATLSDLAHAGAGRRDLVCAREITKLHEEFHRGTVGDVLHRLGGEAAGRGADAESRDVGGDGEMGGGEVQGGGGEALRGEFTLVLGPLHLPWAKLTY